MNLLPQFGFFELMLVAVVALIVVGPKDLPKLMRSAGRMVAKARSLAGEFTAAFDQMAREAEMEELRKEIDELKKNNPVADAKRAVDEAVAPVEKEFRDEAREIDKAVREQTSEKSSAPSSASDKAETNPSANEAAKS
ncbi:Sec-independent protein translocase protein TatB [Hyphococcus sp.]|uniref:Sec-independent protein translocase protein TatB n=1 Tax=Hyphococcus sp. TaxID=2038636 RepID=UPI0035C664E2